MHARQRLPFYVVLETVREALATGWAGGAAKPADVEWYRIDCERRKQRAANGLTKLVETIQLVIAVMDQARQAIVISTVMAQTNS